MVNWIQAWWQVRQSWSFMHHAYQCGLSVYDGVADAWSHKSLAMAYAVSQAKPRRRLMPTRY